MKKLLLLATIVAVVIAAFVGVSAAPVDAAPMHTQSVAEAHCAWHEVLRFGPNPNGVLFLGCRPIHFAGGHQATATVCDAQAHVGFNVLMDLDSGAWVPLDAVWGC